MKAGKENPVSARITISDKPPSEKKDAIFALFASVCCMNHWPARLSS